MTPELTFVYSSLAVLVGAGCYRLLWRRRFGHTGVEGHYLRLRGRVVGPGDPGRVMYRQDSAGQLTESRPFDLETDDGPVYRVDTAGSQVTLHGGVVRVGDRLTVDALHSSVQVAESLYREPALKPAVAALRIIRGRAWPELRWLTQAMVLAGVTLAVTAAVTLARPEPRRHLACPPGTRPGGERPPRGYTQWCELDRGQGAVPGSQESVKHGPYVVWWDRHNVEQVGRWVTWHRNGSKATETRYTGGRRVGRWTTWRRDGSLAEQRFYNRRGRRTGRWISYVPDGRVKLVRRFRNGRAHGEWLHFFPDGKLKARQRFFAGVKHGRWERWNERGTLVETGEYENGWKHGQWSAYVNGRLARTGRYRRNRRHGEWRFWHETGDPRASDDADQPSMSVVRLTR
jgi:antitoxin component YwqK of YwqJK toxin-antitoxin module